MDVDNDWVEILLVEDRFQVTGRGLIIAPSFPLRDARLWRRSTTPVEIVRPDGARTRASGSLEPTHFRYADPSASGVSPMHLVLQLSGVEKEDVPVGSRILAPPDVAAQLPSRS